jgi:hypothetical protein
MQGGVAEQPLPHGERREAAARRTTVLSDEMLSSAEAGR